jgi:hypothetical protein
MLMHYKDMYMPEHLSFVFTDTVKKFKLYISQIVIPRIILSVLFGQVAGRIIDHLSERCICKNQDPPTTTCRGNYFVFNHAYFQLV